MHSKRTPPRSEKGGACDGGLGAAAHVQRVHAAQLRKGAVCEHGLGAAVRAQRVHYRVEGRVQTATASARRASAKMQKARGWCSSSFTKPLGPPHAQNSLAAQAMVSQTRRAARRSAPQAGPRMPPQTQWPRATAASPARHSSNHSLPGTGGCSNNGSHYHGGIQALAK